MSWSIDNFREWTTTILGIIMIFGAAVTMGFGFRNGWMDDTLEIGGVTLVIVVGLWLVGIKDFNPLKYLK